MNTWLFQCNPKRWDINSHQRDETPEVLWTVRQHADELKNACGDDVFLWRAGDARTRGIVARAEIAGPWREGPPPQVGAGEWTEEGASDVRDSRMVVPLSIKRWLSDDQLLSVNLIRDAQGLDDLQILSMSQKTNYRLTKVQATSLNALWDHHISSLSRGQ